MKYLSHKTLGFTTALCDRLREVCDFESWAIAWNRFFGITSEGWKQWWISKIELEGWYNYAWRDGYHTFKELTFITMAIWLLYTARSHVKRKDIDQIELFYGLIIFCLTQFLFDIFIEIIM